MSEKFPINQLKILLEKARQADSDCKQFGADHHKYQWNEPASLKEVEAFEKDMGILLPQEYRDFLLFAGNGGAGPYYGLFSLDEVRGWLSWKIEPEKEPWLYPGREALNGDDFEEEDEEEEILSTETDEEPEEVGDSCLRGCIPIGSQGDSYFMYLLVTGPNQGRVVYVESEISYIFFPREPGFLAWYTRWLREVAANYHIYWFGTNLDGDEEFLRKLYEETREEGEKRLIISSMQKFPVLSLESKKWISEISLEYVSKPEVNDILTLLWRVSPEKKDDFMEQRWNAGMYEEMIGEIFYSIYHLDQDKKRVLDHWGRRILEILPKVLQVQWYMAFDLLRQCSWLTLKDVKGLWDVAEKESKPELIRSFGAFSDAREHMELFLKVLEEREDLKLLNGAVLAVPVVRDELLLASMERVCQDFPYTMGLVEVTDWDDEEQVARWDRRCDEWTVCHNADLVLEQVRETFMNPKVSGTPRPRRMLLQVGARQDMGIDNPHKEGGIGVHPLIAVVIMEMSGRLPATASQWDKVLETMETLTLKPEERYWCSGGRSHWIYMVPPTPCSPLPEPYYYDLHDWSVIGRMKNLKTLVIERLCVDDFSFLAKCSKVETLSLYNTNFSDCRLLGQMTSLKKADLRRCQLEYKEALDCMGQVDFRLAVGRGQ